MTPAANLTFAIASEAWQFEQIHRLNYRTFVEEIPQHRSNPDHRLVDKFHGENSYIICACERRLLGMVAVRAKRPFSLDQKLANLDSYLPPGRSLCEIRLLAVDPSHRSGFIFHGLMRALHDYCRGEGFDLGVISGTLRQLKLYRHLGFVPFGPLVGSAAAQFQPMYVTLEAVHPRAQRAIRRRRDLHCRAKANFLPGPVAIAPPVRRRFNLPPISHRSAAFVEDFNSTAARLCSLVNARQVTILSGSGTLANDAVAAQLARRRAPGLILSNGEFGERLIDHARRFRLPSEILRVPWGTAFEPSQIRDILARRPALRWLWAVHCETSTGVLNDLTMLKNLCAANRLRLSLDCISSIGTVPVDLAGVQFAAAVSGKGLGAFPGLSMVFHQDKITPAPNRLPRYLDLGYYGENGGMPFTLSSNLLYALAAAIAEPFNETRFAKIAQLSASLRLELRAIGLAIVGDPDRLSPAVTTVALPRSLDSRSLGDRLAAAGYLVSYRSGYLLARNWLQICLMGAVKADEIAPLLETLRRVSSQNPERKPAHREEFARAG